MKHTITVRHLTVITWLVLSVWQVSSMRINWELNWKYCRPNAVRDVRCAHSARYSETVFIHIQWMLLNRSRACMLNAAQTVVNCYAFSDGIAMWLKYHFVISFSVGRWPRSSIGFVRSCQEHTVGVIITSSPNTNTLHAGATPATIVKFVFALPVFFRPNK